MTKIEFTIARKMSNIKNDTRCHYAMMGVAETCPSDRRVKAGLDSVFCRGGECEGIVLLFFMLARNASHLPARGRRKTHHPPINQRS